VDSALQQLHSAALHAACGMLGSARLQQGMRCRNLIDHKKLMPERLVLDSIEMMNPAVYKPGKLGVYRLPAQVPANPTPDVHFVTDIDAPRFRGLDGTCTFRTANDRDPGGNRSPNGSQRQLPSE
jgi:hypothetical protein